MKREYLVVLPIENMRVGNSYAWNDQLPLHCTIMPWFTLSPKLELNRLQHRLYLLATDVEGGYIELVSEKIEPLGKNKDVLAHMLQRNPELEQLHDRLLDFLLEKRSPPSKHGWIGGGYRPHVTRVAEREFTTGSRLRVIKMVLLESDGERRTVCAEFYFGRIAA
ncbi:MAG: hypothetical protein KGI71_02590 [Patescibacteria group bacterium]|nr:hypothetical protein [Patescibacteria group bacterium]